MDIARIRKRLKEEKEKALRSAEEPIPDALKIPAEVENAKVIEEIAAFVQASEAMETDEELPEAIAVEALQPSVDEPEVRIEPVSEPEAVASADRVVELLTFKLSGGGEYAFKVLEVQEIIRPHHITRVPRTDPSVVGVASLRGKVVPVLDLEMRLFGRGSKKVTKALILRGPKGAIGVSVERGMDVIRVAPEDIVEPPAHLSEEEMRFIEGVASHGDRFISIVSMEGLLDFHFRETLEGR